MSVCVFCARRTENFYKQIYFCQLMYVKVIYNSVVLVNALCVFVREDLRNLGSNVTLMVMNVTLALVCRNNPFFLCEEEWEMVRANLIFSRNFFKNDIS